MRKDGLKGNGIKGSFEMNVMLYFNDRQGICFTRFKSKTNLPRIFKYILFNEKRWIKWK